MFIPDYKNIENAARNLPGARLPLYEHGIAPAFMERITGEKFAHLQLGSYEEKLEFYRHYNAFQRDMGYDTVTFECCVSSILPGGGALGNHKKGRDPVPGGLRIVSLGQLVRPVLFRVLGAFQSAPGDHAGGNACHRRRRKRRI